MSLPLEQQQSQGQAEVGVNRSNSTGRDGQCGCWQCPELEAGAALLLESCGGVVRWQRAPGPEAGLDLQLLS